MGNVEKAVDAAADFVAPFLTAGSEKSEQPNEPDLPATEELVEQALSHLKAINNAEKEKDLNAPYDGSLVGVVYGLIDLVTSLGVLPYLSPRVAFAQRPKTVLNVSLSSPSNHDLDALANTIKLLVPIFKQDNEGIQPLLNQRALPDLVSGVSELAFSPRSNDKLKAPFQAYFNEVLSSIQPSRLLPMLTTFLQQGIPPWLQPPLSKGLALLPLRPHGIRHTIEFFSLSYLSRNGQSPQLQEDNPSRVPIHLEAITQASRLLASVPRSMTPGDWFNQLAPQLFALLDGSAGVELSKAAGQIIAGGILTCKATGAPGTVGWELFGKPLLQAIRPSPNADAATRRSTSDHVIVEDQDLCLALQRLATITSSYSHPGLIKRLVTPVLNPLWGILTYAKSRPSLEVKWSELPRTILLRYLNMCCDPRVVATFTKTLFWDGEACWVLGPGSQGGVEIRRRTSSTLDSSDMSNVFSRIGKLDERVSVLIQMLVDARIDDDAAGAIFILVTRRWLSPQASVEDRAKSLTNDNDPDPLEALTDAKLSEALATNFKDRFAQNPTHIVEFLGQLLQKFVSEHESRLEEIHPESGKPNRASLKNIVKANTQMKESDAAGEAESEDLVSFALSILSIIIASPEMTRNSELDPAFALILSCLQYLSQSHERLPIPSTISNAATNLIKVIQPQVFVPGAQEDKLDSSRALLKSAVSDLSSPEPPNRAWALSTLRKIIQEPDSLSLVDVPSITHLLLSVSLADPESYVHTAAIPVLVDLAIRVPNPTLRILMDAFIDVEEQSLRLRKEQEIESALDFRLRVGEVLNNLVLTDEFWFFGNDQRSGRYSSLSILVDATLTLASRRAQRQKTLSKRTLLAEAERKEQEEGEAAWGGPIPNLLDPDGQNVEDQPERDALLKIVKGWEGTGREEDVRIRSSALSILGQVLERRLEGLSQVMADASLQMALQILLVERTEEKAILRRAAVLVIMGLLKGLDDLLGDNKDATTGLGVKQEGEIERVVNWVRTEDGDELVRSHAQSVVEGLETLRMKKLYKIGNEQFKLDANLGLTGNLRGLDVDPLKSVLESGRKAPIVEEIE